MLEAHLSAESRNPESTWRQWGHSYYRFLLYIAGDASPTLILAALNPIVSNGNPLLKGQNTWSIRTQMHNPLLQEPKTATKKNPEPSNY